MTRLELLTVALGTRSSTQLIRALSGFARTASDRPGFSDAARRALDQHLPTILRRATGPDTHPDLTEALELALVLFRPTIGATAALDDLPSLAGPFITLTTQVLLTAAAGLEEAMKAEPDTPPTRLAGVHHQLSIAFQRQGEYEWSTLAAGRATSLFRALVAQHGREHLAGLGSALDSLGVSLNKQGDVDGASAASTEAVELSRVLARDGDPEAVSSLAHCLINHSVDLAAVGRPTAALATLEEATELVRHLAVDGDVRPVGMLGWATHNLSVRLAEAGRNAEALPAIQEAVRIRRGLVSLDAQPHLPDLASSLNSLSVRLGAVGRRAEALTAIEEACDIYRTLAQTPGNTVGDDVGSIHLPALARALNNLSVDLTAVGRPFAEALAASAEAVAIRRVLARRFPQMYSSALATSLHNLSVDLDAAADNDAAMAAIEEAIAIRRSLAAARPHAHAVDLASSLRGRSVRLAVAGRPSEAVRCAEEAVDLVRAEAGTSWAARVELARAQGNLATRLSAVERHEQALAAAQEAVHIRRELVKESDEDHVADLATSLNNLAVILTRLDRNPDAVAATEEAVRIRRRLVTINQKRYLADLASSLNNLAVDLLTLKRREDARAAAEESVRICRRMIELDLPGGLSDLVMSAGNLADVLLATNRADEAARLFSDLLAEHHGNARVVGAVHLERAWWNVPSGDIAAVITDGLIALPLLPEDSPGYSSVRRLLRGMRTKDPATFDHLWNGRAVLPPWLVHTYPAPEMVDLVNGWMDCAIRGDLEAEKATLQAHPELLSEGAEAVLDRLIDANPGHPGLRSHRVIMVDSRTVGVDNAYDRYVSRAWQDAVALALSRWLDASDEESMRAVLAADTTVLLSDDALGQGEDMLTNRLRTPDLLWRLGLLSVCRSDGAERAFDILDDRHQLRRPPGRRALSAFEPRLLGLARMRAGREPDDQDAHYVHSVLALVAGHDAEAQEAILRCAELSTTWEQPERARQLAGLTSVRPDLTQGLLQLRQILIERGSGRRAGASR